MALDWKVVYHEALEKPPFHYNEGSKKWTKITPIDLDRIKEDRNEVIKELIWEKLEHLSAFKKNALEDIIKDSPKITKEEALKELEENQISYINVLYKDAIEYLEKRLFYKTEISQLRKKEFKNWEEIIQFVKDTQKLKWKTKCTIIKKMKTISNSYEWYNPIITDIKEKTSEVFEERLRSPLAIQEENENNEVRWVLYIPSLWWIDFIVIRREKSDESNAKKEATVPEYHTVEKMSDHYGLTFYVKEKAHIPIFMNWVATHVFWDHDYIIKEKNLFFQEDIEWISDLDKDFKAKLIESLPKRPLKKEKEEEEEKKWPSEKWTPETFGQIKITTPQEKTWNTKNLSLEVGFAEMKHQNEKWLWMKGVYDYLWRIKERIRDEQYVSSEYIELVVDKFMENLQKSLNDAINRKDKNIERYKTELFQALRDDAEKIPKNKKLNNPSIKARRDELIKEALVNYYKDLLRPVKIWWNTKWRKTRYTTSRWVEISKIPDFWRERLFQQD